MAHPACRHSYPSASAGDTRARGQGGPVRPRHVVTAVTSRARARHRHVAAMSEVQAQHVYTALCGALLVDAAARQAVFGTLAPPLTVLQSEPAKILRYLQPVSSFGPVRGGGAHPLSVSEQVAPPP